MKMLDNISKILEKRVCDHCLGRQFSKLGTGYSNDERGKVFREMLFFAIDSGKEYDVDPSNFYGFNFRNNKDFGKKVKKPGKCCMCNGFFDDIDKFARKISKKLKKIEFETFLVGTRPSHEFLAMEEEVWDKAGIEFVEPIRAEINREVGKRLEKIMKKKTDFARPDVVVIVDLDTDYVEVNPNPIFISGFYNKLKRGFPQCKWGTPGVYKTSVQQMIANPFMKVTKGRSNKFHGAGREDIDAVCVGWRPFVLEIVEPLKRKINLKKIEKEIKKTKKVEVKELKISDSKYVAKIKQSRPDKTYKAIVALDKKIDKKDLKKLSKIKGKISQRTPKRVKHRRADLVRERKVLDIKSKFINSKKFELKVKGTAGLYIKELISGDEGRTKPSVSQILDVNAKCAKLDVIKIEKIK